MEVHAEVILYRHILKLSPKSKSDSGTNLNCMASGWVGFPDPIQPSWAF